MANETTLCKKFLLSAEWDRALAVFPDGYSFSEEDYENSAYVRCFQATKARDEGNYDDVIADASKALVKNCKNNCALCIRAYGYYLNNNYDDAITDCEKVIERADANIKAKKQKIKNEWEKACDAMRVSDDAKKAADIAKKAVDEAVKEVTTAAAAQAANQAAAVAAANVATAQAAEQAAATALNTAEQATEAAVNAAEQAQADYCESLRCTAFARELLGIMYTNMDRHPEASNHYKLALLARQTDIVSASPLLMDAYRNARRAVKGI